ncbi:36998_t:CDS:2 [Gigaspora margarita]|uniref:36998_t:CDS:1 n=1 Tax=Gigaspora margarita TaxID=4874 RepID=A0ABN7UG92_GIGMA|nr:36998_t:CDS:2 [Gigaspora margarita]
MDEFVDLSIEATEAMLNSLNFDILISSFTTIEITIVESPDLSEMKSCEPDNENLLIFSPETLQSSYSSIANDVFSKDNDVSSKDDVSLKDDGDIVDEKNSSFMQSISDYLFSPLFVIFITVAGFVVVIPVIISMKKEKRYEYFVVHATDDCQTTDLESAMCVKK